MAGGLTIYRYINILSIDVAAGALVCALFFAELSNINILPYGMITLFLTVWVIYTIDHLRDAKLIKQSASSLRHRFHQRHFTTLASVVVIAIIINFVCLFFIRRQLLFYGIGLFGIVILYLVIQKFFFKMKELMVATVYTVGVLLPSLAVANVITDLFISIAIQFLLIALLNLYIFSLFSIEEDSKDELFSIATFLGASGMKKVIWIVIAMLVIAHLLHIILFGLGLEVMIMIIMSGVLTFILLRGRPLILNEWYRLLGDGIFLIPAIDLL